MARASTEGQVRGGGHDGCRILRQVFRLAGGREISLLRDVGLPYKDWERRGFHIPVVQAHADYRASAQFDDEVLVKTRVASVGKSSIRFENEVYKLPDIQLLCTGHTVHVLIDGSKKPIAIPDDIRGKITLS